MSPTDLESLETAAFAAWPALEEEDCGGWRLRGAAGYTKRANSANATATALELDAARIAAVEQWFAARGLPTIFRLTSFSTPQGSDERLAARGYRRIDLSWVMARPLGQASEALKPALAADAATWLGAFQEVSGKLGPDQALHLRLLQAIRGGCAFAALPNLDAAACCGLGVVVGAKLGVFDVATRAEARRQGLARALCQGLLEWGAQAGARQAFLQVLASNEAAIGLYESLGFRRVYHYWYRVAG